MDGMCIDKASWQSNVDDKVSAPQLTKEDSAFEAENCQFVWGTQDLTVSDLNALFQKVLHHDCVIVWQSAQYDGVCDDPGWLSTARPQPLAAGP